MLHRAFGLWVTLLCLISAVPAAMGVLRPRGTPPQAEDAPRVTQRVLYGSNTPGAIFDQLNIFFRESAAPVAPQSVRALDVGWAAGAASTDIAQLIQAWEVSGAVPLVTWQPYAYADWAAPSPNSLIAAGKYDDYLDEWFGNLSQQFIFAAQPPRRVFIRFAPAPNGNWYPWSPSCPGCSGNGQNIEQTAASYIDMYRYVVAFGRGATYNLTADTVQWIFDAATYNADGPPSAYYPGHDVVDWFSATGNNYGTTMPGNEWTEPLDLYSATLAELAALNSSKPIALTAAGTVSVPNGVAAKATWLTSLLGDLVASQPRIRMVSFHNQDSGASDLAVFGGGHGTVLFTSPMPASGAYWTYPSLVAAMAAPIEGIEFVGLDPFNPRYITSTDFLGI
jgi:hypothetical protein